MAMCPLTTSTTNSCENAKRGKHRSGCGLAHQQTSIVVAEDIDAARKDRDREWQRLSTGPKERTSCRSTPAPSPNRPLAPRPSASWPARPRAFIHRSTTCRAPYVDVAFHELSADSLYTDGEPARPALVSAWVRAGHRDAETTHLATEIATAVTRITAIRAERVLVVIQSSPARYAVEGGRVLPEPGHEQSWIAGSLRRPAMLSDERLQFPTLDKASPIRPCNNFRLSHISRHSRR